MSRASIHYYFAFTFLKNLILKQYSVFQQYFNHGAATVTNLLEQKWHDILEHNPDAFEKVEYVPASEGKFFELISAGSERGPKVLHIMMPHPRIAPEAVAVSLIMYDDNARIFVCEYSDTHLEMRKAADQGLPIPAELLEPSYVVEELTEGEKVNMGRCKGINDYKDKIETIARPVESDELLSQVKEEPVLPFPAAEILVPAPVNMYKPQPPENQMSDLIEGGFKQILMAIGDGEIHIRPFLSDKNEAQKGYTTLQEYIGDQDRPLNFWAFNLLFIDNTAEDLQEKYFNHPLIKLIKRHKFIIVPKRYKQEIKSLLDRYVMNYNNYAAKDRAENSFAAFLKRDPGIRAFADDGKGAYEMPVTAALEEYYQMLKKYINVYL